MRVSHLPLLLVGLLLVGTAIAAQENIPRIPVLLFSLEHQSVQGSGKVDIDALFADTASQYQIALLSAFTADARYQATSMERTVPSSGNNDLLALLGQGGKNPGTVAEQQYSEADIQRILEARAVVLPSVLSWDAVYEGEGEKAAYRATIELSVQVIDIAKRQLLGPVKIELVGSDPTEPSQAIHNAWLSAAVHTVEKLSALRPLRRSATIAEMVAGEIIIDYGTAAGVLPGDEFDVYDSQSYDAAAFGRLVVRDAQRNVSFAQLVWSARPLMLGDRLEEVGHELIHGAVMASAMVHLINPVSFSGIATSVRLAFNQGLFMFRPLIDLGFIIMPGTSFFEAGTGLPISFMGGGEMLLRLGSFTIAPNTLFGVIFLVPLAENEAWAVGGLRAQVGLRLSLRVGNAIECFLEPGFAIVFSGGTFTGLVASAGVIFR